MIELWDDLNNGDKIYFLLLNGENVRNLFANKLQIQEALVEDIVNTGYHMSIHTNIFEELLFEYKDFFSDGHAQSEYDDNILFLSVNYDGIKIELKNFIDQISDDLYNNDLESY